MNKLAAVLIVGLAGVEAAHATPINQLTDNPTGTVYTLTYSTVSGQPNTYDIFLQVDASHVTSYPYLQAVAVGIVSNASDVTNYALITPPSPAMFTTVGTTVSSLNGNGCSATANAGFICSQYQNPTTPPTAPYGLATGSAGDVYTFEWEVTLASTATLFPGGTAALDQLYVTADGTNQTGGVGVGNVTPLEVPQAGAPEPSSLALLGTGALAVAGLVHRRISLHV
jgi:hypothetical protein